jgi:4-alpha-glucanotransferase
VVERASGILLHPTSLPGRFGIGDLGSAACRFVDFLAGSGQRLWQIMPLGPTSYGDSPYQALSAFAGNPSLINLERLVEDQYLASWDFLGAPDFPAQAVDYGPVIDYKQRLLRLSYENFKSQYGGRHAAEFAAFNAANRGWLDDYALFAALKEYHGGANWSNWERDIATRQPAALTHWQAALADAIQYHRYTQFQFYRQWSALKRYANGKDIRIVGDIPIFVAYDSADAWSHPELFCFDDYGHPSLVAGVPPDFFSPTGQLWGNPLYRWDAMARDGYAWWIERFRAALQQVDIVRLDHFRGFEAYWAVPAGEETAVKGCWVKGPGADLFHSLEQALGRLPIIIEDLGLITQRVKALRDELGFPGMKVLQFAFTADPDDAYLPHNYEHNCVVYTGTHDNDTTLGWWNSLDQGARTRVQVYLGRHGDDISWDLIRLALMSVADRAIFPLQDVLGIGSEGRMNTPGRMSGNWGWRYTDAMLNDRVRERLRGLAEIYGRAPHALKAETEADEAGEAGEASDQPA